MGASNPPDEAGKFITRVDIHTRQLVTAKNETLTLADINSNCFITFPLEDDPEMKRVYGLSVAIHPHQAVYVDTGDISLILVHCGDTVGVFITGTPLLFHVHPHAPVMGLEYPTSYYTFAYLDQPIQIVTDFDNGQ